MQGNLYFACDYIFSNKDSRSKSGAHLCGLELSGVYLYLTSPPLPHPQTHSNSIGDWLYTLTQAEGTRLMARWARHWPSACWCWPRHFAPGPAVVGEVLGVQQVIVPRSPLRTPPWHSPAHETPPSASSRVVNRAYVVQQRHATSSIGRPIYLSEAVVYSRCTLECVRSTRRARIAQSIL